MKPGWVSSFQTYFQGRENLLSDSSPFLSVSLAGPTWSRWPHSSCASHPISQWFRGLLVTNLIRFFWLRAAPTLIMSLCLLSETLWGVGKVAQMSRGCPFFHVSLWFWLEQSEQSPQGSQVQCNLQGDPFRRGGLRPRGQQCLLLVKKAFFAAGISNKPSFTCNLFLWYVGSTGAEKINFIYWSHSNFWLLHRFS